MSNQKTELEKRNIVRLSNQQAKLITKTCLRTALIQLLENKEISDISVSELARKAGVSRTAFYSKYQTVDDVLTELIDEVLSEMNNSIWEAINKKEDIFLPIIQKMKDNRDEFTLVLKSSLEKTAFFQMRDHIKKTYPLIDSRSYYLLLAAVGALRNIILEWLMNDCNESVEFISSLCNYSTNAIRDEVLRHLKTENSI